MNPNIDRHLGHLEELADTAKGEGLELWITLPITNDAYRGWFGQDSFPFAYEPPVQRVTNLEDEEKAKKYCADIAPIIAKYRNDMSPTRVIADHSRKKLAVFNDLMEVTAEIINDIYRDIRHD